ncbi:MAG: lipoprotein, partial [Lachnospiraceae bacterium]|nr:lipoprotein [Lachnospiraceae bacterium]
MKKLLSILASLVLVAAVALPGIGVKAQPTDEILDFTITVDVNDDATLNMLYHIEWKVLDDS